MLQCWPCWTWSCRACLVAALLTTLALALLCGPWSCRAGLGRTPPCTYGGSGAAAGAAMLQCWPCWPWSCHTGPGAALLATLAVLDLELPCWRCWPWHDSPMYLWGEWSGCWSCHAAMLELLALMLPCQVCWPCWPSWPYWSCCFWWSVTICVLPPGMACTGVYDCFCEW